MSDDCKYILDGKLCAEGWGGDCKDCVYVLKDQVIALTTERDALKVEIERTKRENELLKAIDRDGADHVVASLDKTITKYLTEVGYFKKSLDELKRRRVEADKERSKERVFVEHIKNHLKTMSVGSNVECRICDKTIDEIYEEAKETPCE